MITVNKCCNICYDDIVPNKIIWTIESENGTIESEPTICMECINILLQTKLDSYIESIINETCTASIKRMSRPLPTNISIDGSGFGTIIVQIYDKDNNRYISPTLVSEKYSKDELDDINCRLMLLSEYKDSGDPVIQVQKSLLFEKYKIK